jgi:hypothetical protein
MATTRRGAADPHLAVGGGDAAGLRRRRGRLVLAARGEEPGGGEDGEELAAGRGILGLDGGRHAQAFRVGG